MAFLKGKGTLLKQNLGSLTTVAQIFSISWTGMQSETYESDTLDNASEGIPYAATGRTEYGTVSGELFLDPAIAGHKALVALLETPADEGWSLTFPDNTAWAFTGAGFGLDGPRVVLNDGIKAGFSIKVDDAPTFPA